MIQTGFESRVKIQQIIDSQLPEFILDESPKAAEFLKQYYLSVEFKSGTYDLITNIDKYVKVDELYALVDSTILQSDINSVDTSIAADINGNFTEGFPKRNGLLLIDDEIISIKFSVSMLEWFDEIQKEFVLKFGGVVFV